MYEVVCIGLSKKGKFYINYRCRSTLMIYKKFCDKDAIAQNHAHKKQNSHTVTFFLRSYFILLACILFTLHQTSPGFYVFAVQVIWKHFGEKEKLLVTSNFSFSPHCFLPHFLFGGGGDFPQFLYFYQTKDCRLQTLSVFFLSFGKGLTFTSLP